MKNTTNLPLELREYRERRGLTTGELADQFNVPEHEYKRVESGKAALSAEEEKKYRNLLTAAKANPPKMRQWYHSKAWHWVIPVAISITVLSLFNQSGGFRAGAGIGEGEGGSIKVLIIMGAIFCAFYWYFWTPELPFKMRSGGKKVG